MILQKNISILCIVALMMVLLFINGCSFTHYDHEAKLSTAAKKGYALGNYNLASYLYQQLAHYNNDYKVKYANSIRQSKNIDQAIAIYNQVLKQEPNHPKALYGKAVAFLQATKLQDAKEVLLYALQKHPENFDILHAYAILHHLKGNSDTTTEYFKLCMDAAGYNPMLFIKVSYSLYLLGHHESAILLAKKASKHNNISEYQSDLNLAYDILRKKPKNTSEYSKIARKHGSNFVNAYTESTWNFTNENFLISYLENEIKIINQKPKSLKLHLNDFIKRLSINKPPKRIIRHESADAYNDI